jgi:Ca-activated chloride channel family protein
VLRVLAIGSLAVGLMRPETYRTVKYEEDSIDIMIVFDMSKSMEETDLPRDRMDAAQRVVRRFLRQTKHDRVGLVVFGQQAMLRCPLTQDAKLVEQIVRDLVIGDVPALGTAIGDGLALALAQLRRADGLCDPASGADAKCAKEMTCSAEGYCVGPKKNKVVILLSDGDTNWVTRFEPDEAARVAKDMGVQVYTVLVGREENNFFGGMSVNPAALRSVASLTGGDFFRATDYDTFDKGFQAVRKKLDKIKRIREERIPDKQLFLPFVVLAAILLGLDLLLSHTRLRRLP